MALALDGLEKAVAALGRVLAKSDDTRLMSSLDEDTQTAVRSGVQHFEFTYELCWKMIRRWLAANVSPNVVDGVTRRELFRRAPENQLIDDVGAWMRHHDAHNLTSHTYASQVADRVYAAAHSFAGDAARLLANLQARND